MTLGAGYLDVVKDRLYTCAAGGALLKLLYMYCRLLCAGSPYPEFHFAEGQVYRPEPVTKVAVDCDGQLSSEEINKALEKRVLIKLSVAPRCRHYPQGQWCCCRSARKAR